MSFNINHYLDNEEKVLLSLGIFLAFLAVNYNSILALTYIGFLFVYYMMHKSGKTFPLVRDWKTANWKEIFAISGILTLAFLYIISATIKGLQPYLTLENLQAGFATTAFEGNKLVTLFTGTYVIGFTETLIVLGAIMVFLASFVYPRIEWKPAETGFIILLIMTGMVFSIFHATAYKISTAQMISAFIFMFLSAGIVIKRKQMIEAALAHTMTNGIILSAQLGFIQLAFLNL